MFHPAQPLKSASNCNVANLLHQLAQCSSRPRYAFMLLSLIAQVARPDGSAGPWINQEGELISLRDWLCDALTPMAQRGPRSTALAERIRKELNERGLLPEDATARQQAVEAEMQTRVRTAGKSNLSRAVSELVKAGLLRRHYQGYAVDHQNRGAQRHAVYTLIGEAQRLAPAAMAGPNLTGQGELALRA
ncbi:hypothetical protein [Rhizorhapis sp.]|uniref:hypothetical protein n=1 Tax=Rhizorhapis sp. TaxID=1968842 RepID=UPI002B462984|nr:hypothetical protein [Rhizorhapis sp.]HKR18372.1 hypothetical protein [Rhizorhapis sp.]